MGTHTKRSPSKAKRTMNCAGCYALCDALPEHQRNISSEAGRIGTVVHALIERALRDGRQPADFLDWIVELVGADETPRWLKPTAKEPATGSHWYIIDDSMIDAATRATDYALARCDELVLARSALQLETRTNPLPDRDDTSGTADITIDCWPMVLEVADYKNGGLLVDHIDNDQLIAYLLGKALESEMTHERYITTIIQPHAQHEAGRIRSYELTREQLLDWQARYRAAIERCEEAEAAFDPDDYEGDWAADYLAAGEHCTFCDAQAICPARAKMAQRLAKIDFADEPRQIQIDRERIGHILRWAPQLDAFLGHVAKFAQRELENGFKVPGCKLVARGTKRSLRTDMTERQLVAAIVSGGYVADRKRLYATKLKSGPQIEKLVDRKRREEFNAKFLVRPQGAPTIALEDDPRPAIVCRAADDFADFDDDDSFEFG